MSQKTGSATGTTPTKPQPEVVRLSVNLHKGTSDVLQNLAKRQNLSITETIRRAISIYKFVMDEQRQGRKILTMDADEKNRRELILM
jgi:hypothetical protein